MALHFLEIMFDNKLKDEYKDQVKQKQEQTTCHFEFFNEFLPS
jgi:hypothetical protein